MKVGETVKRLSHSLLADVLPDLGDIGSIVADLTLARIDHVLAGHHHALVHDDALLLLLHLTVIVVIVRLRA